MRRLLAVALIVLPVLARADQHARHQIGDDRREPERPPREQAGGRHGEQHDHVDEEHRGILARLGTGFSPLLRVFLY